MQRLRQLTFVSLECDRKKRKTRREISPERMDGLIPWERLEARIAPTCPKGGGKGRQPYPLSVMLRTHCVQSFCNLSDPAMEDRLARRRASGALPGRCLRRFRRTSGWIIWRLPIGSTSFLTHARAISCDNAVTLLKRAKSAVAGILNEAV